MPDWGWLLLRQVSALLPVFLSVSEGFTGPCVELDVEGMRRRDGIGAKIAVGLSLRSGEEECRGVAVPREVVVAVDAPAVVETDVHAVLNSKR